ncbi:energy coupling factor transporter S component ThiW [Clostridium saudiense]|uniref:Energy coupling factor transporter S component ThiW n=1 Tax=Clostridium saudiense TaxID=1414720 RepID=A0ABS2FCF5_9CLOT|nr:energy coupling factor transporter S component ThiW [Clostridium saudiense]MBM6818069.1 energy coupling factor transporter S component ThiW [Clostridium saudiense]
MEISKNKEKTTQKIVLSGILIAIATVLGTFSIPVLGAKASPVQHFVNVIAGITLGPVYGVACAFVAALLRNILGTGSLLAFPGSMVGVFLAALLYKKFKKIELAVIGEVIGTGIIGALLAYPVAAVLLGREVALFVYIVPFSLSSIIGSIIAYIILKIKVIREFLLK